MRKLLLLLVIGLSTALSALGQCPSGTTQSMLNWEYLDFFPSSLYGSYTTVATSQTQKFMFGGQVVTVTHNYSGSNAPGETPDHTGSTAAGYSAEDLQFVGNGSVTFTFQNAVQNVKFAIYDIDYGQKITVTAANGALPQVVNMSNLSGTSPLIAGSGTVSATASASTTTLTAVDNTSLAGAVEVNITGPVTSFTIAASLTQTKTNGAASGREDGSYYISNILACTPTVTLPTNYFEVSKPYTGQPGYVLTVRNDSIYYVNPATGKAKFLFADLGHTNINSMAYDPINHYIYYVFSLTGANGSTNDKNKALRRYDYNMDTLGVVLDDVTKIGIPTLTSGVESGAAAFYNGSLYLGIESSTYESIVWKVDFNNVSAPYTAAQQYGIAGSTHDWADIGVAKGVLYDYDGSATYPDYYHMDLQTGDVTHYAAASGLIPRQTAVDWTGQLYDVGSSSSNTGEITPYLYNGNLDNAQKKGITYNGISETGSWGDAAEAFKPKADFGDAPATYDPDPQAPAMHEIDPNLKLGALSDNEWNKPSVPGFLADQDGGDEDGLPFVTILNNGGNYQTNVKVFNNTGATATVCAWVDFNNNGTFETGEGISQTIATGGTTQTVSLFWNNPGVSLPDNSYTYIRIRVTSSINGMTTANPTGFFDNGEVEDYRVLVTSSPLAVKLNSFDAKKSADEKVNLTWEVLADEVGVVYELQKSTDQQHWNTFCTRIAAGKSARAFYEAVDAEPAYGLGYYRLIIKSTDKTVQYSNIRKVLIERDAVIQLGPNPTSNTLQISVNAPVQGRATLRIVDMNGTIVYKTRYSVEKGANQFEVPVSSLQAGVYGAELWIDSRKYSKQILIRK